MNGTVMIPPGMLDKIATAYNPAHHEAPVVIGHPDTDDPAWGWVKSAEVRDDGLWLAAELTPEMDELVSQQRYKKVSVSLYPPDHPANPTPGSYALKHLGFLGAQPPAVKGLQAIGLSAAESEGILTIQFSTPKEKSMDPEELKAKEAALAQKEQTINLSEQTLSQREQALAQREAQLRKQELAAKIQPHIQAGRVLPRDKELLLNLAEKAGDTVINLGEGDDAKATPLLDAFLSFLEQLPAQVPLKELATPDNAPAATQAPVSFAAPAGYEVDPAAAALYSQVEAYRAKHPEVTYVEAVRAVEGGLK